MLGVVFQRRGLWSRAGKEWVLFHLEAFLLPLLPSQSHPWLYV